MRRPGVFTVGLALPRGFSGTRRSKRGRRAYYRADRWCGCGWMATGAPWFPPRSMRARAAGVAARAQPCRVAVCPGVDTSESPQMRNNRPYSAHPPCRGVSMAGDVPRGHISRLRARRMGAAGRALSRSRFVHAFTSAYSVASVSPRSTARGGRHTGVDITIRSPVVTESHEPAAQRRVTRSRRHVRPGSGVPGPAGGDRGPAPGVPARAARPGRGRPRHRLQRGTGHRRRRQLRQAAQGPVPPGLVRHPRRRLRRGHPHRPDRAGARPHPAPGGGPRRGG